MKQHQSRQGGKQKLREMLSSLTGLVLLRSRWVFLRRMRNRRKFLRFMVMICNFTHCKITTYYNTLNLIS